MPPINAQIIHKGVALFVNVAIGIAIALPAVAQVVQPIHGDVCQDLGLADCSDPTNSFLNSLFNFLAGILTFTAVVAIAAITYGGFMYITSAGDEQRSHRAKMIIVYAMVGLILILASGSIVIAVLRVR